MAKTLTAPKTTVLVEAQVLEERDGHVRVRLLTGFGDPEAWVGADRVMRETEHTTICPVPLAFEACPC